MIAILLSALTCAGDLARHCVAVGPDSPFVLTARVDAVEARQMCESVVSVADGTGFARIYTTNSPSFASLSPGDVCAFSGYTDWQHRRLADARAVSVSNLAHGTPPPIRDFTLAQVLDARNDFAWGRLDGRVVDAFVDELDDRFAYFVLREGTESVIATCLVRSNQCERIPSLIGARVRGFGHVSPRFPAWREFLGRGFAFRQGADSVGLDELEVTEPPPPDPFLIPGRKRIVGRVIAVWQGCHAIVAANPYLGMHRVDFVDGQPMPAYGDSVEVAGESATDSYRQNLVRAIWRPAGPVRFAQGRPEDIEAADILRTTGGNVRVYLPRHYGSLVRLKGRVVGVANERGVAILQCGRETVEVDVSSSREALGALREHARVAVTGTVVFDVPNWKRGDPFPHITSLMLVPRRASDIVVLESPPWWTPLRILLALSAVILALLVVFLRERIRKRLAQLQVRERTRLAIELHASVTQGLSAAGLQLDAAVRVAERSGDPTIVGLLKTSSQTLSSSLMDLRNCLWDLRNRVLDLPDFEMAIRKTVEPHLRGAALHLRFIVPRPALTDDVAHAVLQMLRELVSNAVRHGKARHVRIAGILDEAGKTRLLRFSVSNDGSGFDPDTVPGIAAGHFGLQGLRERVRRFRGRLAIKGDRPVRIVVSLALEEGGRGSR